MVLIDRMSTPSQHLQSMDMLSAAQERMNRCKIRFFWQGDQSG